MSTKTYRKSDQKLFIAALCIWPFSCVSTRHKNDDPSPKPVKIAFASVDGRVDDQTKSSFSLTSCMIRSVDGILSEQGIATFATSDRITTGATCTFQIKATSDERKAMDDAHFKWRGSPGLLFQDDSLVVSVNADGTRTGISKELTKQFDAPDVSPSQDMGSIEVHINAPMVTNAAGIEGQLSCIPLTPFKAAISNFDVATKTGDPLKLIFAVPLPQDSKDTVRYQCGIIRIFKDQKMIGVGATPGAVEIVLSKDKPTGAISETIRVFDGLSASSDVRIDPKINQK